MTDARLITLYRKSPGGKIEPFEMPVHEAEFALSRFPFAWSTSSRPQSFDKWPWPGRAGKCQPYDWAPAK
jgi:hypothetical protein